ncbi:MAG: hypothetical protein ACTHOD_07050 [Motilibacteraceae bacterium]
MSREVLGPPCAELDLPPTPARQRGRAADLLAAAALLTGLLVADAAPPPPPPPVVVGAPRWDADLLLVGDAAWRVDLRDGHVEELPLPAGMVPVAVSDPVVLPGPRTVLLRATAVAHEPTARDPLVAVPLGDDEAPAAKARVVSTAVALAAAWTGEARTGEARTGEAWTVAAVPGGYALRRIGSDGVARQAPAPWPVGGRLFGEGPAGLVAGTLWPTVPEPIAVLARRSASSHGASLAVRRHLAAPGLPLAASGGGAVWVDCADSRCRLTLTIADGRNVPVRLPQGVRMAGDPALSPQGQVVAVPAVDVRGAPVLALVSGSAAGRPRVRLVPWLEPAIRRLLITDAGGAVALEATDSRRARAVVLRPGAAAPVIVRLPAAVDGAVLAERTAGLPGSGPGTFVSTRR